MIPLLLFQMMILLSSPLNVLAELATVSKPGCQARCGEVPIPFPFGIGVDCYLHPWYEVNCSSNYRLFLISFNLEVLNISIEEGTMLVNYPILSTCKDSNEAVDKESVILQNSPFSFSQTGNILFGQGCDSFFYISYNRSFVAGCYSSCRKNGDTDLMGEATGCYGIKCCQTRIPSSLQAFNVYFDPLEGVPKASKKGCKKASLVQEKWFTDLNGSFNNLGDKVPVVLDWGIINNSITRIVTTLQLLVKFCPIPLPMIAPLQMIIYLLQVSGFQFINVCAKVALKEILILPEDVKILMNVRIKRPIVEIICIAETSTEATSATQDGKFLLSYRVFGRGGLGVRA
ncbi:hypothetical protein Ddye_003475 [Dipteronia dyeriana]|uniref:Wall-associated receptor kinase galacturonan-binding domain-containing protein n=1 Tax=Dipteronia dyeriana TaxID=168575 RepID=A0AAE0CVE3_9ROSI|nr:hypothetical protein Ddye_003475 [Dipteronia dyeriana]